MVTRSAPRDRAILGDTKRATPLEIVDRGAIVEPGFSPHRLLHRQAAFRCGHCARTAAGV